MGAPPPQRRDAEPFRVDCERDSAASLGSPRSLVNACRTGRASIAGSHVVTIVSCRIQPHVLGRLDRNPGGGSCDNSG